MNNPPHMTLQQDQNDGLVLLLDKPPRWTSFDVVRKVRSALGVRKVGHAGTLDPMATGLLILCTGRRTREIDAFMGMDKEYDAELTLGARTASFDADTPVLEARGIKGISEEQVQTVVGSFIGTLPQVPPMWSALKVHGKRLYTLARKGQTIERKPRSVTIHRIEITSFELPLVRCTIACSKGTYIRSLAEDIGVHLGCGAYVSKLRRTRIGPFHIADALTIEQFMNRAASTTHSPS